MTTFWRAFLAWLRRLLDEPTIPPAPASIPSAWTPPLETPTPPTPADILYETAKSMLGKETVPGDADDELGCALAVNTIHKKAFGEEIGGGASTYEMYRVLSSETDKWAEIKAPEKGAIIISPTGFGNGTIKHGHVGICGIYGIMSNDSRTGRWEQNYSYEEWEKRFQVLGGFPVRYFRRV